MSALNHLPPDLIEAILPLLPPKSLGRFKSVSKRWYSLISSPNFIKTYIQNFTKNNPNPEPTQLILVPEPEIGDLSFYSLDIKQLETQTVTSKRLNFQDQWVRILGSCNGLVLADDINHNLCLVNPATGKTLKVLVGKRVDTYGFGYDFSTDDYKIISISYPNVSDSDANCTFVRVYSLRNNSWNLLPNAPYELHDHFSLRPGVLLNNNLHWIVISRHSTMTIAAFSLASEKFQEIEFPDKPNYYRGTCCQLCVLGGKLVAVFYVGLPIPEFVYEL